MATAVARVAFAADSGGGGSSKAPKVAAAINAAFGRFADPAKTSLFIGGDEYSVCNASTMKHYDKYLTQPNISPARCVMTPGNHTNGPGGASNIPDVSAWLSYNAARGTKSRTDGGWINRSQGIPMTDQYVDVAGIRFIFLNSGACENVVDKPGWPVPHTGGSVAGNARVAWLRSAWRPGTRNVVITHHARWSYYGGAHDNPTMQNLIDEIMGKNDGTSPHSSLILQGHDHCMQLMHPQGAKGTYPGLTSGVIGLGQAEGVVAVGDMVRRGITMRGHYAYTRADFDAALATLAAHPPDQRWLTVLPLSEGAEAFRRLVEEPEGTVKALLAVPA